jgi:putative spermidine/putrescine transport system ATP-binding protein
LVRLTAQADKLPGQISGGQQQRVAIARAVVVEPPVVLMDEPLSNLDAKLRLEMRAEIRRIHSLVGGATIYVTHDQDEALSLADRIVVMREGRVRQIGTPEELYGRPTHPDVAEFMGYRNLVASTAQAVGNLLSVTVGGAPIMGVPVDAVPGAVTVAIRPEDLTPSADAPIPARVEMAEYRGRDFYGLARTDNDTVLYFRSEIRVVPGETVRLGAPPERVLVYAEMLPA